LALAAEVVDHAEFARARHGDPVALHVVHGLEVVPAHRALALDLDRVDGRGTRGRATDVEGTHGELRARLADRLRGDDAHRLADVDAVATREVAPVALRADAVARRAGDGRADHHLVHARLLELAHQPLIEQFARLHHHLVG